MLHNVDCMEFMRSVPKSHFDLVLTDIPYGEVNRKSGGLRGLDKGVADTFDNSSIPALVSEIARNARLCLSVLRNAANIIHLRGVYCRGNDNEGWGLE